MQISGSFPAHIASAYGVAHANPATRAAQPIPIKASSALPSVSSVHKIGAELNIARPKQIDRLVGATVNQQIRFDGAATAPEQPGGPLQLYTSAADKIDAAVAVNVGRAIDVKA